jgi:hypothetical protein
MQQHTSHEVHQAVGTISKRTAGTTYNWQVILYAYFAPNTEKVHPRRKRPTSQNIYFARQIVYANCD